MRIRLIRTARLPSIPPIPSGSRRPLLLITLIPLWLIQPLVRPGTHKLLPLITAPVPLVTAPLLGRTAANGKHPEQRRRKSERSSDPHRGQEPRVKVGANTIDLSRALYRSDDHDSGGSRERGTGADGNGGESGEQPGDATKCPGTVGKQAKEESHAKGDVGDDKDDLGPFGDGREGLDRVGDFLGEGDVLTSEGQHGVEVASGGVQDVSGPVKGGPGALS